ncbi:hypothetical protein Hanom_Chr12g01089261 [Helianthus anomalus]
MVSGTGIKFTKSGVFSVPVFTLKYRCRTSTDRYRTRYIRYMYPLLEILTVF